MNEEQKEEEYSIPVNVTIGFHLFPGFGKKEMIISLLMGTISVIIMYAINIFIAKDIIFYFVIFLGIEAFTVIFITESPLTRTSALRLFSQLWKFSKSTKRYMYVHRR